MAAPDPYGALAGALTESGHAVAFRVYYEDTDFTGVVYHARYLHFFERGRSDYLRLCGINHVMLEEARFGEPLFFVVKSIALAFSAAARIDDILTVETASTEIRWARIVMQQRITRAGMLLASAEVSIAVVAANGKPRRVPSGVRLALSSGKA